MLECITTLCVAATATRQSVLGTCVLQLPLRSPAAVAKQAAALQLLSGGRFVLGVGIGDHPGEYERAGVDFATRGRALDEGMAALRRAWRTAGEPAPAYAQEPTAPTIPVWVGGSSPAALRRAAASADGWVPLFLSPEGYATALARLREAAVAAGRASDAVLPAVVVPVCVGVDPGTHDRGTGWLASLYGIPPKAFGRHLVAGPADRCAERVRRYLDAGAEHVAVMVAADGAVDQFAALADALAPAPSGVPIVRPNPAGAEGNARPDLMEVPV